MLDKTKKIGRIQPILHSYSNAIIGAECYKLSPDGESFAITLAENATVTVYPSLAYVYKKISAKITPEIESLVNTTLDDWFGTTVLTTC